MNGPISKESLERSARDLSDPERQEFFDYVVRNGIRARNRPKRKEKEDRLIRVAILREHHVDRHLPGVYLYTVEDYLTAFGYVMRHKAVETGLMRKYERFNA